MEYRKHQTKAYFLALSDEIFFCNLVKVIKWLCSRIGTMDRRLIPKINQTYIVEEEIE